MSAVKDNLKEMFAKLEEHVSTKTVVGDPVHIGDVIMIPLVDVSLGMGTAMVANTNDGTRDGGGGALGAKMIPSAMVVVSNGTVQLVNLKNQESTNKLLDMVPGLLSKLDLGALFKKKEEEIVVEVETDEPIGELPYEY